MLIYASNGAGVFALRTVAAAGPMWETSEISRGNPRLRNAMRALLTHTPEALAGYYGETALAGLKSLCDVRLNDGDVLDADGVIELAAGCDIIVSDRNTPAPAAISAGN